MIGWKIDILSRTRPYIALAVSLVCQFMHNPRVVHLHAAHRILQYLVGIPRRGILYQTTGNAIIEVYIDADYAGSITDRRSTTGYCSFAEENLVIWRSKKWNVVTASSAES